MSWYENTRVPFLGSERTGRAALRLRGPRFVTWIFLILLVLATSTGLAATTAGPTEVSLQVQGGSVIVNWQRPSNDDNVSGYFVYFDDCSRDAPGCDAYQAKRDAGNGTALTLDIAGNFTRGRTWFVTVTAYNSAGESEYANEATVFVPTLPPPAEGSAAPVPPTNVEISAPGDVMSGDTLVVQSGDTLTIDFAQDLLTETGAPLSLEDVEKWALYFVDSAGEIKTIAALPGTSAPAELQLDAGTWKLILTTWVDGEESGATLRRYFRLESTTIIRVEIRAQFVLRAQ